MTLVSNKIERAKVVYSCACGLTTRLRWRNEIEKLQRDYESMKESS